MFFFQAQTQHSYHGLLKTVEQLSLVELNECVSQVIELQIKKMPVANPDDEVVKSAVNGTLELLMANKNNNLFHLYPIVGAEKIICDFPLALLQKAIVAIGHYVNVVGLYKYQPEHPYPYYVKMIKIEIYPDKNKLPSFI